jgi:hypothetical protein
MPARTHGMTRTKIYRVWKGMHQRCRNPRNKDYKDYGARGVTVCERWYSFEVFMLDMGPRPEGYTIDRVNGAGNYEPSNCRWATYKTQMNNRRGNRVFSYNGETLTMTEWADRLGVHCSAIKERLERGWPLALALTAPSGWRRPKLALVNAVIEGGSRGN